MKLQDENGIWKEGNQLDSLIINYFQFLFSTLGLDEDMDFLALWKDSSQ